MKKIQFFQSSSFAVSLLLLTFTALSAQADRLVGQKGYYSKSFYEQVEKGLKDKPLKDKIHGVLVSAHVPTNEGFDEIHSSCSGQRDCYQHSALSYSDARRYLLGNLDLKRGSEGYELFDVYCQKAFSKKDFPSGAGPNPDQIPDHNVFNVEHTWPQSRFSRKFPSHHQKSDLLILYGVSSKANSSRGNIEFSDVQTEQSPVCPSVRRGWVRGTSGSVFFEPPEDHKGNVARSLFYFAVRYQLPISEVEEESLRRWHRLDPIDDVEKERHEEIFKVQKVRNPFIDHPELADMISDF